MANSTVGTIQYNAVINTDDLDKGASKVSSIVGGIGKATAAVVAAGAVATAGLVAASVKAYADYEQLVGGVDTLFKDSSSTVQKYAENAYKTAGLSANQYMETVTGFSASLLQGLGGDTKKAAEIGNMAVTDMADNANKMGTSMEMIQNAYQGFAKDNFTMLDNLKLGYGGTQAEMARLINDSKVMGEGFVATAENVKDIPFDKLIEGIHVVQTEMGITGTTAKEAAQTIRGSFDATKAAWENMLVAFSSGSNEGVKAALDGLMESAGNLLTNVSGIVPMILAGIGHLVEQIGVLLPGLLNQLIPVLTDLLMQAANLVVTMVPQLLNAAVQLFTALVTGLAEAAPKLIPEMIKGIMSVIDTIVENLPLILDAGIQLLMAVVEGLIEAIPNIIPAVIEAVMTMLTTILDHLPEIIEGGVKLLVAVVQGLADALPTLIKYIPEIINTLVKTLTNPDMLALLIKAALQIVIAIAWGLIQAIPELVKAVPQLIGAVFTALGNGFSTIWKVGEDLVKGLWNGISNMVGWIGEKIKSFGKGVLDGIKGFFGIKSPSRLFRDEIGKNLALGVGEGFTDTMGEVAADMQNALPIPSIDVDGGVGEYATDYNANQTVVVKIGEETIATKVVELINDKTRLTGFNAITV